MKNDRFITAFFRNLLKGIYPDCECEAEGHVFSAYINQCYIACPENAIGLHPDCRCDDRELYYDQDEFICKSLIGRKCPDDSIGVGPLCLCVRKNYIFSKYLWGCYYEKGAFSIPSYNECSGSNQRWPQCEESIDKNALLSLVG